MQVFISTWPFWIPMGLLLVCSGFFSASEAAIFSLRAQDRRKMLQGSKADRVAARLLNDPDGLLSTILFCNLLVNMAVFTLSSLVALRLADLGQWAQASFAMGTLLTVIIAGEMVPKTLGVLAPIPLARFSGWPLTFLVRLLKPLHPWVASVNQVSQRLFVPQWETEQSLEAADIERAISLSGNDEALIKQEQAVVHNIVQLSNIRIDEWMRPRTQFEQFRPPVKLSDLQGNVPTAGYLFITEPDSEEIELAIRLDNFFALPADNLERLGDHVLYLPWCATVADALEGMSSGDREVTVVVNEYGETIGVLTIEDVLETIFTYAPSRSRRLLDRNPLHPLAPGRWIVAGIMSLRQLSRRLNVEIPRTHSVTVAGVIQEEMQRLAQAEDECVWGPFHFRVVEVGERGNIVVELTLITERETQ